MQTHDRTAAVPAPGVPTGAVRKAVALIGCGLAAVLVAATLSAGGNSATASNVAAVPARHIVAGDFVGFDAAGLPVYRLPAISVAVDRKTALARIARDDTLARTSKLRVRTSARDTSG